MKRWHVIGVVFAISLLAVGMALARQRPMDANGNLVTVNTAAGIPITVSSSFAPKVTAFISDLVAQGYKPKSIKCFAHGGHVRGSRHYSGNACDIDQRARNRTASAMYHVASLARAHGLRDGCSFRDCGHVDDGRPLHHYGNTMLAYHHRSYTVTASARSRYYRMAALPSPHVDRLLVH